MLRASTQASGIELNLQSIGTNADPGRQDARDLLRFADALVTHSGLSEARTNLANSLGDLAVPLASGAAGNFEMMNRILDGAGIPVPASTRASVAALVGLDA